MRFMGLDPRLEAMPLVEIGSGLARVDLHDDAVLREINIHLPVAWTLESPAWLNRDNPELESRETTGGASLIFTGVSQLRISGPLVGRPPEALCDLDFIEYNRRPPGVGEVRSSSLHDAEIEVVASCCQLRCVDSP